MKNLRILGLAAIATMAMLAYLGVGSASGVVLCTAKVNPCPAGKDEPAGTKIEATLNGSASWATTGGTVISTCTIGTHKWEMENTGGLNKDVIKKKQVFNFANCTSPAGVLALGEGREQHISGTENATMFDSGTEITMQVFGVDCVYGTGSGTDMGTAEAGSEASLSENAVLAKISGSLLCPNSVAFKALWTITNPKNLSWQAS